MRTFKRKLNFVAVSIVLWAVVAMLAWNLVQRESEEPVADTPAEALTQAVIYGIIQTEADKVGLDPCFVLAIAFAESSLDPDAVNGGARGLMQMTEVAWVMVTGAPFEQAFNPELNIAVAVAYLAYCRDLLEEQNTFSYPLLAASYRFGPNAVRDAGYEIPSIQAPQNRIYQRIFSGEPVDTVVNCPE